MMLSFLKNQPLARRLLGGGALLVLGLGGWVWGQNREAPRGLEPGLAAPTLAQAAPKNLALVAPVPASLPPEPVTVWDHLQRAHEQLYVVLLRHALAPGTGDPANFQLGNCATQRNLSPAGRNQAERIGTAFRQRQIAVAQVLSSEWCRCLETANLMDVGPVEPFAPLNSFFSDRSTALRQTAQVQDYLRSQPNQGVIVMVTHQVNITALTGIVPGSGQAVVMTLDDAGDWAPVGLLDAG